MRTVNVVIVGGGITALSAARKLTKMGQISKDTQFNITVYEATNRLGGKILTYRDGGLILEAGPDSMLARKPAGVNLVRELGLESELVNSNSHASHTYIVRNGQLEHMPQGTYTGIPADVPLFVQNKVLSQAGKLRALFDLFLGKSPTDSDISLGAFLRSRLGDEWVNYIGEPFLAGIYAGSIDQLSLEATWGQFKELAEKYRSLIIGARAMKAKAPVNQSGRSAFVTIRGGLQTLIERLADEIADHARIELSHTVRELQRRAEGGYLVYVDGPQGPTQEHADAVILCTPPGVAKRLLSTHLHTPIELDVPYVSTATVILGYPKAHVDIDLSNASGFLVPRAEKRAITASTWTSSKWPHTTTEDYIILRCYVGRAGQQEHLQLSDKEMVQTVHQEVKALVGIKASPVFNKVTRWNEAMPNYLVGHRTRVNHLKDDLRSSLPGVYVAGNGYDGLGIPDCIRQGEETADFVISDLVNA